MSDISGEIIFMLRISVENPIYIDVRMQNVKGRDKLNCSKWNRA